MRIGDLDGVATAATQPRLDLEAQLIREPFRLVDFVMGQFHASAHFRRIE